MLSLSELEDEYDRIKAELLQIPDKKSGEYRKVYNRLYGVYRKIDRVLRG